MDDFASIAGAFAATLDIHLVICDCSAKGWRAYAISLESELQDLSHRTIMTDVTVPIPRVRRLDDIHRIAHEQRASSSQASSSQPSPPPYLTPSATEMNERFPHAPPGNDTNFSIRSLQNLQYLEEKTHKAGLVLKLNLEIMGQLQDHYRFLVKSAGFASVMKHEASKEGIQHFESRLNGVMKDLQAQVLKLETLVHLIGGRKALVGLLSLPQ